MRTTLSIVASALIFLSGCSKDETVDTSVYDCSITYTDSSEVNPKATNYQHFIDEKVKQGFPGMILLVKDSNGLWTGVAGMADLYNEITMKKCNLSRIASITKNFTATAIFQLQDEGKLKIDDLASAYLTTDLVSKLDNLDECTIRQLIEHTSGIYDYDGDLSYNLDGINHPDQVWSKEKSLSYAYGKPALFKPGTEYSYCNTGYILLGLIVESLEGKAVQEVMQERIFAPSGMVHTLFPVDYRHPAGLIPGYDNRHGDGELVNSNKYAFGYYTDGGMVTDAYGLYQYMHALYADKILINDGSLQQMVSPSGYESTEPNANIIANGPVLWETPYGTAYTNSGGQYGYRSFMAYFPASDTYIVMLLNSSLIEDDELFYDAQEEVMHLVFE
ncbi:MAG TPA: serine hydrolase domain-containing protein [Chitinophagales bacterium]|nr:serine hydrolase domain-containing protein [Chitinophagales bacterium]